MTNHIIVITGAGGFIGSALTNYFNNKGWEVRALLRAVPAEKIKGVSYHHYQLENEIDTAIFRNASGVIHAAYQHNAIYGTPDEPNIEGTRRLITMCRELEIKLVFLSSFSAIPAAKSNYGRIKNDCEDLCDPAKELILKPGLILGGGGLFGKMLASMQSSAIFPVINSGNQPLQTLFIDDLCEIIETGLIKNISGIFAVAEEKPATYKEFIRELAKQLKRKVFFIYLPATALLFACRVLESIRIKVPVNSDNILGLKHLSAFNTTGSLQTFGIKVKNYRESLQVLLLQK